MIKETFAKEISAVLSDTKNVHVLEHKFNNGQIRMTTFPIVSGIYLVLNEVEGYEIPFDIYSSSSTMYTINYCLSGRCEFHNLENAVGYISPGITCIGKKEHLSNFSYPLSSYTGYEIYFIERLYNAETRQFLNLFELDIPSLFSSYIQENTFFIGKHTDTRPNPFTALISSTPINLGQIRCKVIQLLHSLLYDNSIISVTPHYITPEQSRIAKKALGIFVEDLSIHIPVKKVSDQFGISETSLKNYFREVYGNCISDYLTSLRMKEAARLLVDTDLSILQIANKVGYTNQGHFAKVFQQYRHMKPLAYRHSHTKHPIGS